MSPRTRLASLFFVCGRATAVLMFTFLLGELRPMAIRPASSPPALIDLDTLARRHAQPARTPKPATPTYPRSWDLPAISRAPSAPADRPSALVLVVTITTCSGCGFVTRSSNAGALVRYDRAGFSNSVHYTRATLAPYLNLPRELKEHHVNVPFCERCFDAPREARADPSYSSIKETA